MGAEQVPQRPLRLPLYPSGLGRGCGASQGLRTHRQRPPYLHALCQQVPEARPTFSPQDLLQCPGQCLPWLLGALSREGSGGRSA